MIRAAAFVVFVAALCGCSAANPDVTPDQVVEPDSSDVTEALCGTDKAAIFVGRRADAKVRNAVAAAVGDRDIRWIKPEDVVTQDFIPERLNMRLDASDKIKSTDCG